MILSRPFLSVSVCVISKYSTDLIRMGKNIIAYEELVILMLTAC
jgi:hypothetical protein